MPRLALSAGLLAAALAWTAPAAADCPAGAEPRGASPPEGDATWCEADGVRHGPWTMWFRGGRKMHDGTMKRGKLDGRQRSWYRNGQLAEDVSYADGERAGRWRRWHPNGQLASDERYQAGRRHGEAKRWRADGSLAVRQLWERGFMESETLFDEDGNETTFTDAERTDRAKRARPVSQPPGPTSQSAKLPPIPGWRLRTSTLADASSFVSGLGTPATCERAARAARRAVPLPRVAGFEQSVLEDCRTKPYTDVQRLCLVLISSFSDGRSCFWHPPKPGPSS